MREVETCSTNWLAKISSAPSSLMAVFSLAVLVKFNLVGQNCFAFFG